MLWGFGGDFVDISGTLFPSSGKIAGTLFPSVAASPMTGGIRNADPVPAGVQRKLLLRALFS